MERAIASRSLDGLAHHLHRNKNALLLEPIGSETVFVIGPLTFGHNAPGCRFQCDSPESEFIEGQHASPFRRMPESSNGIG
jgi:hypothetical protein